MTKKMLENTTALKIPQLTLLRQIQPRRLTNFFKPTLIQPESNPRIPKKAKTKLITSNKQRVCVKILILKKINITGRVQHLP